jgi:serine/threonine protein kinase/tetratricopeptide (TPR) repeat protein
MPVAALHDLSETYFRFAAKIGVISDADVERELPTFRGKEPTAIGKALVEKGILHPNNFKLLESMFARQLARMTHAIHATAETPRLNPPPAPPPKDARPHPTSQELDKTPVSPPGFDIAKGDTTKLKGSAQPTTRYKVVRPLGTGRLSELFVAEDVELHREVVLKRLKAKHQRAPGYRIRFNRTAEVTSGLEHPCIPPIYNHGLDSDGRPYFTTRYLVGENLDEAVTRLYVADPGDPPRSLGTRSREEGVRRLLRRLLSVCDAISYAHGRGVVHGSLTPQRVMLGQYNETLVVGWGRAELIYGRRPSSVGAKASASIPQVKDDAKPSRPPREASRSLLESATPYTSPEQLGGEQPTAGILSDVYGLGGLLFFITTGKPPFAAPAEELPATIEKGLQPGDFALVEKYSASLGSLCAKAMSVDPAKRHATVREFAGELESWLQTDAAAPMQPAFPPTVVVKPAGSTEVRRLAIPVVGACVLCAALGAWIGRVSVPSIAAAPLSVPTPPPDPAPTSPPDPAPTSPPAWLPLAVAAAAATPDAIASLTASIKQFPFRLPAAERLPTLIDAAEAALKSHDDAKALNALAGAEPLLVGRNDASATALRRRWAVGIATIADRSDARPAAALLERMLAAVETHQCRDAASWLEPTRTLAHRLARLYAAQGRFAEAIRGAGDAAPTDLAFAVERAEWLGFADRHAEAAAEFQRIVERLAANEARNGGDVRRSTLRVRALVGYAEQLVALEQAPAPALEAARKAASDSEPPLTDGRITARLNAVDGFRFLKAGKYKEAEAAFKRATDSWTTDSDQPRSAAELLWAAAAWDGVRRLHAKGQRLMESIAAADRAAAFLNRVPTKETTTPRLDAIDDDRGVALVQLGKLPEAEAAFSRIVERGGARAISARYLRSACRLERKNFVGARSDADELAKGQDATAKYLAVRVFARLSGAEEVRTNAAAKADGDRAMTLLRELAKSRYFTGDRASLPSADPELEALRQRADFKESFATTPAATATASQAPAIP